MLDEQPAFLLARIDRTFSCPDQREAAAQLYALEHHVDFALIELLVWRTAVSRLVCSQSQTITVPPYCPEGITPSNWAYSRGWSSVRTAKRLSEGFIEGPLGTAQDTRTPLPAGSHSAGDWRRAFVRQRYAAGFGARSNLHKLSSNRRVSLPVRRLRVSCPPAGRGIEDGVTCLPASTRKSGFEPRASV